MLTSLYNITHVILVIFTDQQSRTMQLLLKEGTYAMLEEMNPAE